MKTDFPVPILSITIPPRETIMIFKRRYCLEQSDVCIGKIKLLRKKISKRADTVIIVAEHREANK